MAIVIDATSGNNGTTTPNTFTHTCTGSNLILFVAVRADATGGGTTGVTYNSVALTKIDSQLDTGSAEENSLWYLINPATGANSISVSFTGAYGQGAAASYTGAQQLGVPDAKNKNATSGTSALGVAVTTIADNCWVIGSGQDNNGAGITSAGAGTTARKQQNNSLVLLDSNGVVTPAGSKTLNLSDTANAHLTLVVASFAPSIASLSISVADVLTITATPTVSVLSSVSTTDATTMGEVVALTRAWIALTSDAVVLSESVTLSYVWPNQARSDSTFANQAASASSWSNLAMDTSVFTTQSKS